MKNSVILLCCSFAISSPAFCQQADMKTGPAYDNVHKDRNMRVKHPGINDAPTKNTTSDTARNYPKLQKTPELKLK